VALYGEVEGVACQTGRRLGSVCSSVNKRKREVVVPRQGRQAAKCSNPTAETAATTTSFRHMMLSQMHHKKLCSTTLNVRIVGRGPVGMQEEAAVVSCANV